MFENIGTILTGMFALVAVIAGGVGGANYQRIALLKASNEELRQRDIDREATLVELRAANDLLRTDLEALSRQVHGDEKLDALIDGQQQHNTKAEDHWKKEERVWLKIEKAIETNTQ